MEPAPPPISGVTNSRSASLPPWLIPHLVALQATALTFRYRPFSVAIVAYNFYWLFYFLPQHPTGPFLDVLSSTEMLFARVFASANVLLIMDAGKDLRRVDGSKRSSAGEKKKNNDGPEKEQAELQSPLWKRWLDAIDILTALRGVGWHLQVNGVPVGKPATYPRWKFVLDNLGTAVIQFLFIDLVTTYIRSTPLTTLPITRSLRQEPLARGLFLAFLIQLMARFGIDMIYRVIAAVAVAVGWHDPSYWPPMFGAWRDAYTVRRFWSRTWHQMMRSTAQPPVNFLLHDVLHIRKGSYWSNYGKVFGAFFVSYLLHGYGSTLAGGNHRADWNYFMSQAVAIWLEETIVDIALLVGVPSSFPFAKAIGSLWTTGFLLYSVMIWIDRYAEAGSWTSNPMDISVVQSLLRWLGMDVRAL